MWQLHRHTFVPYRYKIAVHAINASAYRPLSAFKTQENTDILKHEVI